MVLLAGFLGFYLGMAANADSSPAGPATMDAVAPPPVSAPATAGGDAAPSDAPAKAKPTAKKQTTK